MTAVGVIAAEVTGTDVLMFVTIGVLLLVLVFLAMAEMGLSKMTKPRAAALLEERPRAGASLQALMESPERWINPLLLTVNICQTVQATLTGIVAGRLFGGIGVVVGVTLNVVVFFVLAEAVPKTYAVLHPDRAAMVAARPVRALAAFAPLQLISSGLIGLTNIIVRGRGLERGPFVSEQEFLGIVEAAAEGEVIEHEERELIESIIEFGDTVAREVMVPRPDMVIVANEATVTDALNLGIAHGFSRLPVFGDDETDIAGIAFTKDLIRAEREGRGDLPVLDLSSDRSCSSPRTSRSRASCVRCRQRSYISRSSLTSTAISLVSSPWRTASRNSSERSSTSTTPIEPTLRSSPPES